MALTPSLSRPAGEGPTNHRPRSAARWASRAQLPVASRQFPVATEPELETGNWKLGEPDHEGAGGNSPPHVWRYQAASPA
jgi:hypothetical protein